VDDGKTKEEDENELNKEDEEEDYAINSVKLTLPKRLRPLSSSETCVALYGRPLESCLIGELFLPGH
jgi:hypothetical protein